MLLVFQTLFKFFGGSESFAVEIMCKFCEYFVVGLTYNSKKDSDIRV